MGGECLVALLSRLRALLLSRGVHKKKASGPQPLGPMSSPAVLASSAVPPRVRTTSSNRPFSAPPANEGSKHSLLRESKWIELAETQSASEAGGRKGTVGRDGSTSTRPTLLSKRRAFCTGATTASLLWLTLATVYIWGHEPSLHHMTFDDTFTRRVSLRLPRSQDFTNITASIPPVALAKVEADVAGPSQSASLPLPVASTRPVTARAVEDMTPTPVASPRSSFAQRYTDMTCFLHGDESELCRYDNAICYDGTRLVFSVPEPPGPTVGSNTLGHIMREHTANCLDMRHYETAAPEYTNCRYDSTRFHRIKASLLTPAQLHAAPLFINDSSLSNWSFGNSFPNYTRVEPTFLGRDVKSDWAIPLTRRRWGPQNRGQVLLREVSGNELFGPHPADPTRFNPCPDCVAPVPPTLPAEMRVSEVSQFGNTTVTWLDGALWLVAVDAQFSSHIYHLSTRILSLFSAQLHNSTEFGENPADGYQLPFTPKSHPIEITWHHKTPTRRRPLNTTHLTGSAPPDGQVNVKGFVDEADAPNRVQYMTGSQFPNLPPIDYVGFVGPSAMFQGVPSLLPFLQAMLKLSGQRHTHYFAREVTSKLSPNNLLCSKRGAVVGTHASLFPSRAEAWLFRQSAYDYAGLTRQKITSHDAYPPNKITLITRKQTNGRYFENQADVIAALQATGLEVEVIENLGKLSFKQVVATMAGTGILIAAHGAALVNSMFLPQHAVVIEIFPYFMKKMTYWNLCSIMSHFYFPLYTWTPPVRTQNTSNHYVWRLADQLNFTRNCVERNVSTIDALLQSSCNSVSKMLPIQVNMRVFGETLREAIDVISVGSPAKLKLAGLVQEEERLEAARKAYEEEQKAKKRKQAKSTPSPAGSKAKAA